MTITPPITPQKRSSLPSTWSSIPIVAVGFILALATSARAQQSLPGVPAGWQCARSLWDLEGGRLAVVVEKTSDPADEGVLLVSLTVYGQVAVADLPGRITQVELSRDGSGLLAAHVVADVQRQSLVVASSGTTAWTKTDPRSFHFSNTGEGIVAWSPAESGPDVGTVQSFRLNGDSLATWTAMAKEAKNPSSTLAPQPLRGALGLGPGDRVVVGLGRAVACIDIGAAPPELIWSTHLDWDQPQSRDLYFLSPSRIAMRLDLGRYKILNLDGDLVYPFAPMDWGAGVAPHRPTEIPGSNEILFADPTAEALVADPVTGALRLITMDVEPPSGMTRVPGLRSATMLFASSTALLLRPVTIP